MKVLAPKHTGYYHQKMKVVGFYGGFYVGYNVQSHPSPLRKAAPIFAPPPRRPGTEGFCHEFRKVDPYDLLGGGFKIFFIGIHIWGR